MKGWCRQAPMKKGQQVRGSLTCSFLGIVCQREKIVVCSIPWQRKLRLLWQIWIHNQRSEKNAFVEEKTFLVDEKGKVQAFISRSGLQNWEEMTFSLFFVLGGSKMSGFPSDWDPPGNCPLVPNSLTFFFFQGPVCTYWLVWRQFRRGCRFTIHTISLFRILAVLSIQPAFFPRPKTFCWLIQTFVFSFNSNGLLK